MVANLTVSNLLKIRSLAKNNTNQESIHNFACDLFDTPNPSSDRSVDLLEFRCVRLTLNKGIKIMKLYSVECENITRNSHNRRCNCIQLLHNGNDKLFELCVRTKKLSILTTECDFTHTGILSSIFTVYAQDHSNVRSFYAIVRLPLITV